MPVLGPSVLISTHYTDKCYVNIISDIKNIYSKSSQKGFFEKEEHRWINSHPILFDSFKILENYVQQSKEIEKLFNATLFLKVDGSFACAIDSNKKFVLIFPELLQLLKSSKRMQAIAVLMHELGHLALEHQKKATENQQSQIEADLFANQMGLGKFLLDFLKERSRGQQINKRILALEKVIKQTY